MAYFESYEKGREAFLNGEPNDAPMELSKSQYTAWRAGYREAAREAKRQEDASKWKEFSSNCPWHIEGACRALTDNDDGCYETNCAPLYFKEHHND